MLGIPIGADPENTLPEISGIPVGGDSDPVAVVNVILAVLLKSDIPTLLTAEI